MRRFAATALLRRAFCTETPTAQQRVQRVQVFSDTVCPWCWVGKHTLHKIVGELQNPPELELLWTPYLLDPKAGKDGGITVKEYYTEKYGPEAAALLNSPDNPLIKAGAALGLHFNDQRRIVPTMTSHRLLELAQEQAADGAAVDVDGLVEGMFVGYFVEAENLGDVETLVVHAVRAGLDETATREYLLGSEGENHVKNWDRHAKRKLRVPSVPHFVFHNGQGPETVRSGGEAADLRDALHQLGYS